MTKAKKQLPTFSVTQLNSLIGATLSNALPGRFILRGEISNWKRHSSGHCYFSLKDAEGSQIPCVMWSSKFRGVKFECESGLAVLATGYVDVYVPGGKYQFYAEQLEPAGIGDLQLAFEQMRRRLAAEGLFEEARKQAIPRYATHIGVVTSRTGAAVQDIIDSVTNRWPCAKIYVFNAPVQGPGSAVKIAAAIGQANRQARRLGLDVLIVGRGGGSMEDLWAFNEEPVARAIFASELPVISAVGHEVDVTIADLVADARASTPTKAGVLAVPDYREQLQLLHSLKRRLDSNTRSQVQNGQNELRTVLASRVFRSPWGVVQVAAQRVDELAAGLVHAGRARVMDYRQRIDRMRAVCRKIEPSRLIAAEYVGLERLGGRNKAGIVKILSKNQLKLAALENRLDALNPRSVLSRGYSITMNGRTGDVVTDVAAVNVGDPLVTEVKGGAIHSKTTKIEQKPGAEATGQALNE